MKITNLKQALKNKLNKKELTLLPASFDVVGDLIIFSDFPTEVGKKEKIIANTSLETHSNVKTVLKKVKKYSGK